jgi:uncharacterized membrane protein YozB (DUF420 family)
MYIFNPGAPPLSDLSLILQVIIVAFLALAVYFRLRHSYPKHAVMMGAAIGLHTAAILVIMVPSLLSMDGSLADLSTRLSLITLMHAMVGSVVEIMGIWLVAAWLTDTARVEKCVRRRNVMRVTIALWLVELVLGIYIYMMLYLGA